jgi:hypothetical protein
LKCLNDSIEAAIDETNSENHSMIETTDMETHTVSILKVTYMEMSSSGTISKSNLQ